MARSRIILLACCLFCVVVGARWAYFSRYGTDLPEMDQWDAEGQAVLFPWSRGQLHFGDFFSPQNEHRIALTRFLAFGLTKSNGQWDQRLEAACVALFPAAIAVAIWLLAAGRLTYRWQLGLFLTLVAVYTLPVAWQNILSGFASPQFFLIGLALGAMATLPFAEPYRAQWWAGGACALLSLGSMGSGFFVAGVVGGILGFQVWRGHRRLGSALPGAAVCALAIAAGIFSRTVVPENAGLKAHSLSDFFITAARALGWPAFEFSWGFFSLILFVPWIFVTFEILRPRNRGLPLQRWNVFLSGLGLWVVLQVLAAAYARGSGGPAPASRYVDTLIIGSIVNLLCLHCLWQRTGLPKARRNLLALFVGGWSFLFIFGLAGEAHEVLVNELPPLRPYHYYCEQNVRNYLITGDEAYLKHPEIPYPAEWALKHDLDLGGLANRLPASVRTPISISPGAGEKSSGFSRFDARVPERLNQSPRPADGLSPGTPILRNAVTWGSYASHGSAPAGLWVSRPMHAPPGSWLKFQLAGELGRPGLALDLRDPATHQVLAIVRPDKIPGDTWRSALVRAPQGEFLIAAQRDSGAGWFAFSEPVEMSGGSYATWRVVRRGGLIATLAGVFALGLLGAPRKRT